MSSPGTSPVLNQVYNAIKALEAKFPIPQTSKTYVVGTFDAATGHFTYAIHTESAISRDTNFDPSVPGGPVKPLHIPIREAVAIISAVNVENVTLQFNVVNRQGRDFVLSVPGFPDVHAPQGQDFVTLNVAQVRSIESFILTCGKRFMSRGPIEIYYQIIGAGAFTIPALPVAIVYAPPLDRNKQNKSSWSQGSTIGTSVSMTSTRQSSSTTNSDQLSGVKELAGAIKSAGDAVGKDKDPTAQAISGALNGVSTALSLIPALIGDTTVTSTVGSSSSKQNVLTFTVTTQNTLTTNPQSGGPGSGDIIYFLKNARLSWFANNGVLHLALLGWDRSSGFVAETLRNSPAQAGLNPATAQALLGIDPFGSGGPQANLPSSRFRFALDAELNGFNETFSAGYTITQQDTSTSIQTTTTVTDVTAGLLSFLGIGPSSSSDTTLTTTFSSSTQNTAGKTISDTVNLFAAPDEIYGVEIYYDSIFGTFAYRSVPVEQTAKVSGTVHNLMNAPVPNAQVTLVNNGRRYVTKADAHGRFAFHSASITPGHTVVSYGHVQSQVAFAGKPISNVILKPTALRTA